jgi:Ca2+-binding RTX toxin-like protein
MAVKFGTGFGETLLGTDVKDSLFGLGGNDTLKGGGGDDLLDGGTGADRMFGGTGNDVYVVGNVSDLVVENAGEGFDRVDTTLTSYSLGSNVEHLTYKGSSNFTGNGNSLDNTITGGNFADKLFGNGGNDVLKGGGGADVLDGGTGADKMFGGTGGDTYIVNSLLDVVTENAGEGTDLVKTTTNSYSLGANVENLTFTGVGSFTASGNNISNIISGGSSGDILNGNGGSDTLKGGGGSDRLFGGTGSDVLMGGTGNDLLVGGSGSDKFSMSQGDGHDTISDFKRFEGDKLAFSGTSSFNQFTIFNDASGNAHVLHGNTSVTLVGVSAGSIDASFFSFA